MVTCEIACRGCPLKKECDSHLGPYSNKNRQIVSFSTHFECPSYTCGDGRKDAITAIQSKTPKLYRIEIDGIISEILAVSFGQSFQKFAGVIASFPKGDIFSLPPEKGDLYYSTGQSAFY